MVSLSPASNQSFASEPKCLSDLHDQCRITIYSFYLCISNLGRSEEVQKRLCHGACFACSKDNTPSPWPISDMSISEWHFQCCMTLALTIHHSNLKTHVSCGRSALFIKYGFVLHLCLSSSRGWDCWTETEEATARTRVLLFTWSLPGVPQRVRVRNLRMTEGWLRTNILQGCRCYEKKRATSEVATFCACDSQLLWR